MTVSKNKILLLFGILVLIFFVGLYIPWLSALAKVLNAPYATVFDDPKNCGGDAVLVLILMLISFLTILISIFYFLNFTLRRKFRFNKVVILSLVLLYVLFITVLIDSRGYDEPTKNPFSTIVWLLD